MENVITFLIKEKEKLEKEILKAFDKEPKDWEKIEKTELLLNDYETAINILQNKNFLTTKI